MAAGRGAVLLSAGIVAILFAFALMPRCADIPQFSALCLYPWLPVMIMLIVLGGGAIAFGAHSLLKGAALSPWRYLAAIPGLVLTGYGISAIVAATIRPSHGGAVIVELVGLLLLGLGVIFAYAAFAVGRGKRATPPQS